MFPSFNKGLHIAMIQLHEVDKDLPSFTSFTAIMSNSRILPGRGNLLE